MEEFVIFVLTMFTAVWGSAFMLAWIKRFSRKIESGSDDPLLAAFREETDQLRDRLSRLEDEVGFFKELHAPDEDPRLPPEGDHDGW